MTRPRKSDAQLDAEAVQVGLRQLIGELRRAMWYEIRPQLHQRQTSTSLSDELDAKGWPKDADEGGVGPPYSAWMHLYLRTNAGPSTGKVWDRGPDPRVRPAMDSIYAASEWCHAVHTDHQRPGYTLSLCAEMLSQVARFGQEPEDLAWHFDLPLEEVSNMLLHALRRARSHRIDSEARLSRQPGTEAPIPERRPYRPAA
jgi:hypothetical protein